MASSVVGWVAFQVEEVGMGKRCMCGSGILGGRWRGIIPGLEPSRPGGACMPIPGGPPGGPWFPAELMK